MQARNIVSNSKVTSQGMLIAAQDHGFQVVREEPEVTHTGKVHPLRLLRPAELLVKVRSA